MRPQPAIDPTESLAREGEQAVRIATRGLREARAAEARSTFEPAIRLLPEDLRPDARRLYGLLRTVDDLVDERAPDADERVEAIERWADGRPYVETRETRTLEHLARRHDLPHKAVIEFCDGMRHDMAGAAIDGEADLERYCQQVGGSVGVVLARMFGASDPECERRMAMLGRAYQRTNILRDIDEDRAHGRTYLARSTIERFGPPLPGRREELLRNQIACADRIYDEGLPGIELLPRGRRAMALSTALYREILREIERTGYGRVAGRVAVASWRTRMLTARHRLRSERG